MCSKSSKMERPNVAAIVENYNYLYTKIKRGINICGISCEFDNKFINLNETTKYTNGDMVSIIKVFKLKEKIDELIEFDKYLNKLFKIIRDVKDEVDDDNATQGDHNRDNAANNPLKTKHLCHLAV